MNKVFFSGLMVASLAFVSCAKKVESDVESRPVVGITVLPTTTPESLICKLSYKANFKSAEVEKLNSNDSVKCSGVQVQANDGTFSADGVVIDKVDEVPVELRLNGENYKYAVQAPRSIILQSPTRDGSIVKDEQVKIKWNFERGEKNWTVSFDVFAINATGTFPILDLKKEAHDVKDLEAVFRLDKQILAAGGNWVLWVKATTRYCDLSGEREKLDPTICSESTDVYEFPLVDPAP